MQYLSSEQEALLTAEQLEAVIEFMKEYPALNPESKYFDPDIYGLKKHEINYVLEFYQNFLECKKQDPYAIIYYNLNKAEFSCTEVWW